MKYEERKELEGWVNVHFNCVPSFLINTVFEDMDQNALIEPSFPTWAKKYGEDYEDEEEAYDSWFRSVIQEEPMWGTYFTPRTSDMKRFIEDCQTRISSTCTAWRVYYAENQENYLGYYLALNACGELFWEPYWKPLKALYEVWVEERYQEAVKSLS